MATIGITAGPPGPEPAAQMASETDGGGRIAAPAELGQCSPRPRIAFGHAGKLGARASGCRSCCALYHHLGHARPGRDRCGIDLERPRRTNESRSSRAGRHSRGVGPFTGRPRSASAGARACERRRRTRCPEPSRKGRYGRIERRDPDGGAPPRTGDHRRRQGDPQRRFGRRAHALPGVGQRRAEAIVELRTRLKRFRRVQDLLRVKGIGPRSLKRLMPHMVLDAPAPVADAGGSATASP